MVADTPQKDAVIRRRVLRGTIANYVGQFITLGTGFVLTPFVLHQLGATSYGLWVLAGSVAAYGALLDLGISTAVIKYVAEYRARGETEQAHGLVATALCLYTVLGLIAVGLSAVIAPVFPVVFNVPPGERSTATWLVLLAGVGIGLSIPCATPAAVLRGLQRFDLVNLIGITGTLLVAAATVAVLLLGGGVLGLAAVSIPIMLIMQVPSIWLINRIAPDLRFGWRGARRSLVRTVIAFSTTLFVMEVSDRAQRKTDEIVIGAFLPISAVTPYAIARRLSEMGHILTNQFMKVLLPLASELHAENDQARLRALYIVGTRLTLAIFLPVAAVLILLARPLLVAWVGAAYGDYAYLVAILTLASLIDSSQWPAGSVLQGMARHQPLAAMSICAGLANLGLSMALVQTMGLAGVALGTLIPTAVICLGLMLPYAMRVIGVSAREAITEIFLPALLPVVLMVGVLYAVRQAAEPSSLLSIIIVAGVGLSVYVIGYLSFGAREFERAVCRNVALGMIRFVKRAARVRGRQQKARTNE